MPLLRVRLRGRDEARLLAPRHPVTIIAGVRFCVLVPRLHLDRLLGSRIERSVEERLLVLLLVVLLLVVLEIVLELSVALLPLSILHICFAASLLPILLLVLLPLLLLSPTAGRRCW